MIQHNFNISELQRTTLPEFWEEQDAEQDEIPTLESRHFQADGIKIWLQKGNDEPVLVLETERAATISCQGFESQSISDHTSDHWLLIQEQGSDDVYAIYNEPADVTDAYELAGLVFDIT